MRADELTPREIEIVKLSAASGGRTTRQVADMLGLSFFTVRTHRANIMRKLRARSFYGAVGEVARREQMLTRKDYVSIAEALRHAHSDAPGYLRPGIAVAAEYVADALYQTGGLDENGNRRFKIERFFEACGLERVDVRS